MFLIKIYENKTIIKSKMNSNKFHKRELIKNKIIRGTLNNTKVKK
jgi:hypothetical protein